MLVYLLCLFLLLIKSVILENLTFYHLRIEDYFWLFSDQSIDQKKKKMYNTI